MSDITIEGDVKAQQGIRFNIFQLNQTYLGKPIEHWTKGFTGEKWRIHLLGYGSLLYSFLYGYKDQQVARNLLTYRYKLDKAIENAQNNLGFKTGLLYPMVTMNGRNANEWEITHEEIHRNGRLLLLFLTIIALPVITLIFLKRTRSFNCCTLLASKS
jgi:maltose phosphorylase